MTQVCEHDVIEAYTVLLGRKPETGVFANNTHGHDDVWAMVRTIVDSREFRLKASNHGLPNVPGAYLSRLFDEDARKSAAIAHRKFVYNHFTSETIYSLSAGVGIDLGRYDQFCFKLALSTHPAEGELEVVCLYGARQIFSIGFSFLDRRTPSGCVGTIVFVARMQGIESNTTMAAFAKEVGVSAQPATFAALQGLAASLGVKRIETVSARHQLGGTASNLERLKRVYDDFSHREICLGAIPSDDVSGPSSTDKAVPSAHRRRRTLRRHKQRAIAEGARARFTGTEPDPLLMRRGFGLEAAETLAPLAGGQDAPIRRKLLVWGAEAMGIFRRGGWRPGANTYERA